MARPLRKHIARLLACCALLPLLSGCLLASGEQSTSDTQPNGGNLSASFVSAEGGSERTIATGASAAELNVIASVHIQQGELRIDVLDANGAAVLAIQGRPDEQVTKIGKVSTDSQGNLRYRVVARGARNGGYDLLYQVLTP